MLASTASSAWPMRRCDRSTISMLSGRRASQNLGPSVQRINGRNGASAVHRIDLLQRVDRDGDNFTGVLFESAPKSVPAKHALRMIETIVSFADGQLDRPYQSSGREAGGEASRRDSGACPLQRRYAGEPILQCGALVFRKLQCAKDRAPARSPTHRSRAPVAKPR